MTDQIHSGILQPLGNKICEGVTSLCDKVALCKGTQPVTLQCFPALQKCLLNRCPTFTRAVIVFEISSFHGYLRHYIMIRLECSW